MKQMPSTRPESLKRLRGALARPGHDWTDDENAVWAQFQKRYERAVFAIGRRWRLSPADCDVLVTEVFTDAHKYLRDFDYDPGRGQFRQWLGKIVRTKIASMRRRQHRYRGDVRLPSSAIVDPRTPEPRQPLQEQEAVDRLLRFVFRLRQELGDRDSLLVDLVWLQKLPIAEAAKRLKIQSPTARKALQRARELLMLILEEPPQETAGNE